MSSQGGAASGLQPSRAPADVELRIHKEIRWIFGRLMGLLDTAYWPEEGSPWLPKMRALS